MILLTLHNRFKFSYLQLLYEASSRAKTPFFRVDSSAIQVIEDPLNFYIHLNVKIIPRRQVPIIHFIESAFHHSISELGHSKGIYYRLLRNGISFVRIWCQQWHLIIIVVKDKKMVRLRSKFYKDLGRK